MSISSQPFYIQTTEVTQAQWEAVMGNNPFYFLGWYCHNSNGKTQPVAQKSPNAWGCDTSGNVWECCQDWYGRYTSGAVTDPTDPSSYTCGICP